MKANIKIVWSLVAGCMLCATSSQALDLTGDESLQDGELNGSDTIVAQADGVTFSWADKDGDGTPGDRASAGLNLGSYNLSRTYVGTPGMILDLNDGISHGSITWSGVSGGGIYTGTSDFQMTAGPLTITNAVNIRVNGLYAHVRGTSWALPGKISVFQSGDFHANEVRGEASQVYHSTPTGGAFFWGGGPDAGSFEVLNGITTYTRNPGSVWITGYKSVSVGLPGIEAYSTLGGGSVLASVRITDIGSGGIDLDGGSITTANQVVAGSGSSDIELSTSGGVTVHDLTTRLPLNAGWIKIKVGDVSIDADADILVSGTIDTRMTRADSYSFKAGDISITSANGSVTVGTLLASSLRTSSEESRRAGNVSLTSFNDLKVTGDIDLSFGNPAHQHLYGILNLTSTGPGSKIEVQDLDCDLFQVSGSTFDAAGGESYIRGTLSNFDVDFGTRLSAPEGQVVYYDPNVEGNEYLGGAKYVLSGGGILRTAFSGTLILLK